MLITSQNPNWPGQMLDVPMLDQNVAADFLVNRTGDLDRQAARDLADALGGLPLALEQAAIDCSVISLSRRMASAHASSPHRRLSDLIVVEERLADLELGHVARARCRHIPVPGRSLWRTPRSGRGRRSAVTAGVAATLASPKPQPVRKPSGSQAGGRRGLLRWVSHIPLMLLFDYPGELLTDRECGRVICAVRSLVNC
jgi:hypothetical protein